MTNKTFIHKYTKEVVEYDGVVYLENFDLPDDLFQKWTCQYIECVRGYNTTRGIFVIIPLLTFLNTYSPKPDKVTDILDTVKKMITDDSDTTRVNDPSVPQSSSKDE